jgi:translation initiation factor 3 subunit B
MPPQSHCPPFSSFPQTGLRGFDWSPKGNMIAYWAPEKHQQPARVVLVEVPSKNEIRRKPLYHVEHCELFWQSEGEYLGIKVRWLCLWKKGG